MLGGALVWQGRPDEAEPWVQRAERTVRAEAEPAEAMAVYYVRGLLELTRGRDADALTAYQAAERLAGRLAATHYLIPPARARLLHVLVRLGDTQHAEESIADLGEQDRDRGDIRIATAVLRLAQDDPEAAAIALAPVAVVPRSWPCASCAESPKRHPSTSPAWSDNRTRGTSCAATLRC